MARLSFRNRLKQGELDVVVLELAQAELVDVPRDQRRFYLFLGQLLNEIAILQSLLFRTMKGGRGKRPVQETSLGMTLFLARSVCGRVAEAHSSINSKENGKLLTQLWDSLPLDASAQQVRFNAEAARNRLNRELKSSSSLMRLVRNKLAYHLDQDVLDSAFLSMPEDLELADFHTCMRGTTFFGVADTAAAVAIARLAGSDDIADGVDGMVQSVIAAIRDLQDFADGYLLAFYLVHFGAERLEAAPRVRLAGLPDIETSSLGFYMVSRDRRL